MPIGCVRTLNAGLGIDDNEVCARVYALAPSAYGWASQRRVTQATIVMADYFLR